MGERRNEWRPQTADGRPREAGFSLLGRQTVNESGNEETNGDRGPRTADRGRQAFQPVGEAGRQRMGERRNEWRPQTADRGGQAFQPVGEADRQRIGERINEWRPQTADRVGQALACRGGRPMQDDGRYFNATGRLFAVLWSMRQETDFMAQRRRPPFSSSWSFFRPSQSP